MEARRRWRWRENKGGGGMEFGRCDVTSLSITAVVLMQMRREQ